MYRLVFLIKRQTFRVCISPYLGVAAIVTFALRAGALLAFSLKNVICYAKVAAFAAVAQSVEQLIRNQ